ncbi:hypothetical protein WN944_017793 [Citrus x changshan-huyou]|uniref:Phytocyanin domain-containing protein n=1 Tax=Citrus x changshan-huyou TaxID=2935761 RepID=A0AAP0QP68_9ROSI
MATMATALLILLLVAPAVYAVEYTVGDTSGWTQGFDYTGWVSGKTFKVGDVLVFNYGGLHKVDRVSESDYNNCASSNALESHDDGNTRINLKAPGTQYFICPSAGHCPGGMKLAVTVVAASPSGTNTPSGSPSSTPATTGTPPSTTSSPANGAACFFCSLYYNVMAVLISFLVVAVMG